MKAFDTIELILEKYIIDEKTPFQVALLSIRTSVFELLTYAINSSPSFLQVAQKMIMALNIALESKDASTIRTKLQTIKFQDLDKVLTHLENIYENSRIDGCRHVICEIQDSFSDHCIKEASVCLAEASRQLTVFQYTPTLDKNKAEEAAKRVSAVQEKYEKISDFCKKYKASM